MRTKVCGIIAAGLLMCLGAASAKAQDAGKFTFFGGYDYQLSNMGSQASLFSIDEEEEACVFTSLCNGGVGLNGYTGSVTYNVNSHFGIEANFSGHNGDPTEFNEPATADENGLNETLRMDNYIYTFGPAVRFPVGNWSFFGHALMGGVHSHVGVTDSCIQSSGSEETCSEEEGETLSGSSSGNGFALKVGGGVDWNHGRWGIRLAEVDYVHTAVYSTLSVNGEPEQLQLHSGANNIELATGLTLNVK